MEKLKNENTENNSGTSKLINSPSSNSNKNSNSFSKLKKLDEDISNYFHKLELPKYIEFIFFITGRVCNVDSMIVIFLLTLAYNGYFYGNYTIIVRPLICVFVSLITTLIIKFTISRKRPNPNKKVLRHFDCKFKETNGSMPSGDSMQMAALSVVLIYFHGFPLALFLVPFVMISRIFYFYHYFSDTFVGAIIGFLIGFLLLCPLSNLKL